MDNCSPELAQSLLHEAHRINSTEFIANDPVQFPRRFSAVQDIEIVALLCSAIAWGNRRMICNNCEKMLGMMDYAPYNYLMDRAFEELNPATNIHRTFFARNLQNYMRGLFAIYSLHRSLNDFAKAIHISSSETPAWELARAVGAEIAHANNETPDSRCLPNNLDATALKRLNMALRWLVRNDGIVDMGVWDAITPAQLFIPLDVHVGNTARDLGLLNRRANDRTSTILLTETLRQICPEDPILLDFALFGLGIEAKQIKTKQ